MGDIVDKLEYLEEKVNGYAHIERQLIKILFASDSTLEKLKEDPSLINDSNLFIDSDFTMLGLDDLGGRRGHSTADGMEVSKSKGILLIEAKDITNALLQRLQSIVNNEEQSLYLEGIVDVRIQEVHRKLDGSVALLNRLLKPIGQSLTSDDNICIGLFIDYKLTDVDEFGLTGDIGLLRDEIDEYCENKETKIFTNKGLREMEDLIEKYSTSR